LLAFFLLLIKEQLLAFEFEALLSGSYVGL